MSASPSRSLQIHRARRLAGAAAFQAVIDPEAVVETVLQRVPEGEEGADVVIRIRWPRRQLPVDSDNPHILSAENYRGDVRPE